MSARDAYEPNPRQNVTTVFAFWRSGRSKRVGPVSTNGETLFSYSQPILTRGRDERTKAYWIVAEKKKGAYTTTTAQHVSSVRELVEPHRSDSSLVIIDASAEDVKLASWGDGIDEVIAKYVDKPDIEGAPADMERLSKMFKNNPPTRENFERLFRELVKWAEHKPHDRTLVTGYLRATGSDAALDINADRGFWFGEIVDDMRRRMVRLGISEDGLDEDMDQAVMFFQSRGDRDRRARDVGRAAGYTGERAHDAIRVRVERKRAQRPPGDFEENPPWVTRLIADSLVTLQETVPSEWLPKIHHTVAGKGNTIKGELVEYGCGAYGCVMPTVGDKNVVLKLTSDPSEAKFATEIADSLPTPCVVRYHQAARLQGAERHGREVFLLWRESADAVGQIHKVVGMHAERAIRKQHKAALDAYIALVEGDVESYFELLEVWKKQCMAMAKVPELEFVAIGMLRAWNEKGVFISDTHGGNLGLCMRNGAPTWVITDPGNVVLSTTHADERSRLRTARTTNPPDETPAVKYHGSIGKLRRDHAEMIADDAKWSALAYVGIQASWDDDDNEIELELRNCPCGSTLGRELPRKNPVAPKRGAQAFFEQYAGFSYRPGETRRAGRLRSAREYALAEYVLQEEHPEAFVAWEVDPEARAFWGEQEPEVEEYYQATLYEPRADPRSSDRALASLGAIGDPDANYRRVIEAELAYEAWGDRVEELVQQLQARRGRPMRINPDATINPMTCKALMRAIVANSTKAGIAKFYYSKAPMTVWDIAHDAGYLPYGAQHPDSREKDSARADVRNVLHNVVPHHLRYLVNAGLLARGGRELADDEAIDADTTFQLSDKALEGAPAWLRIEDAPPFEWFVDLLATGTRPGGRGLSGQTDFDLWKYIEKFQRSRWGITLFGSQSKKPSLLIGHDAGDILIAVEVSLRSDSPWPSTNIVVRREPDPKKGVIEQTGATSFPHSPMEFMALLQPFLDKYHP